MRVAIDSSPLNNGHSVRGIGVYTRYLKEYLPKIDRVNDYFFFQQKNPIPDADVVHYPFFDLFFLTLPLIKTLPTIVTIHDVIPLLFPQHFPAGLRGKIKFMIQKLSLLGCKAIITDSLASKRDIIQLLGVDGHKIYVVHLAPAPFFRPITDQQLLQQVIKKYRLPKQFVLYVGDVSYNKNLKRLIEAVTELECHLVMVGKVLTDPFLADAGQLVNIIDQLDMGGKIKRLGFVEDEELTAIYSLASVLALPSLAEGFGLPILEAMACGLPVVTSDRSSMAEIAQGAAEYIDPCDVSSIAAGIRKILRLTSDQRIAWQKRGFDQVKRYSWEKAAMETVAVYKKVTSAQ